ncbi:MAG TPA: phage recombination protein Bet [Acidimicrobiales bacterium]|nr:phage recombination protein Bet [Acidimicrobiales bacterium]
MSAELEVVHPAGPVVPNEKLDLLKRTLADRKLSDLEFELFVARANQARLDPFASQIHAIKRDNRLTIQTGIDGYRLIAERTGRYAGQDGPWWADDHGVWFDLWLGDESPVAARVVVKRVLVDGTVGTFPAVALWREYAPDDLKTAAAFMWRKMPAGQLAKCCEALALRKAFPADLSGLYVHEELDQAGVPVVEPPTRPLKPGDQAPGPVRATLHRALDRLNQAQRTHAKAEAVDAKIPNIDGNYFTLGDAAGLAVIIFDAQELRPGPSQERIDEAIADAIPPVEQ